MGKDRSTSRLHDAASEFQGPDIGGVARTPGKHTLGVSLLGACSSKGCPTKSAENEDRYALVRLVSKLLRHAAVLVSRDTCFPLVDKDFEIRMIFFGVLPNVQRP